MDVKWARDAAELFQEAYGKKDLLKISAATGQGIDNLIAALCDHLDQLDEIQAEAEK